jgi:hypothetical protein
VSYNIIHGPKAKKNPQTLTTPTSLANAEMRLLMAKFLWTFDMELLPDSINWSEQKSFALWKRPVLNIKLYRAGAAIAL